MTVDSEPSKIDLADAAGKPRVRAYRLIRMGRTECLDLQQAHSTLMRIRLDRCEHRRPQQA